VTICVLLDMISLYSDYLCVARYDITLQCLFPSATYMD